MHIVEPAFNSLDGFDPTALVSCTPVTLKSGARKIEKSKCFIPLSR